MGEYISLGLLYQTTHIHIAKKIDIDVVSCIISYVTDINQRKYNDYT